MDMNITRNNIKIGDTVWYTGPSKIHPAHGEFTNSILKRGKDYIVEFVFLGEGFEQLELQGEPEYLFIHDQFIKR